MHTLAQKILGLLSAVVIAMMVAALAGTLSPASAAKHDGRSAREVTRSVLTSANPQAAFLSLSATDRATFLKAFARQTAVTTAERGGPYTPTAAERAAMTIAPAPAKLQALAAQRVSGCWYHYSSKAWSDLGIHDGDTWMQLNWCGSGGRITSWSQSNVGCAGYHGASCSVASKAERNVSWEIRSIRYYTATFFGFSNSVCMQIRGGATGLYSTSSSNRGCSLD